MKKLFIITMVFFAVITSALAQNNARISFVSPTTWNFGTFPESKIQTYVFKFKNTGNAPLIVNQAVASCGCTVATYTKKPVAPGETGEIKVSYNGRGKFEGHFKKSITVRTNGLPELVRLYVEGNMTVEDNKQ